MDQPSLESALADLNLPAIRFFTSIDSTNDEAWRWIDAGAPHRALVIADEQTAGRGRFQRHWVTTAGKWAGFQPGLALTSPHPTACSSPYRSGCIGSPAMPFK